MCAKMWKSLGSSAFKSLAFHQVVSVYMEIPSKFTETQASTLDPGHITMAVPKSSLSFNPCAFVATVQAWVSIAAHYNTDSLKDVAQTLVQHWLLMMLFLLILFHPTRQSLLSIATSVKDYPLWRAWAAQLVEHLTLGFGSGHHFRMVRWSPALESRSVQFAWISLSFSALAPCSLSLSNR